MPPQRGYIAYTNCTAALAEVVPFGGKTPTLGTNPHSWGFPTTEAVGFPVVIDWATSMVAMGRVQQFAREGQPLPPNAAVDAEGKPTTDAGKAKALLPFGAHKGYGLGLINEIVAALIGGSLPTLRCRRRSRGKSRRRASSSRSSTRMRCPPACLPAAAARRTNVRAVIQDILGPGNEACLLPGQIEAQGGRAFGEGRRPVVQRGRDRGDERDRRRVRPAAMVAR